MAPFHSAAPAVLWTAGRGSRLNGRTARRGSRSFSGNRLFPTGWRQMICPGLVVKWITLWAPGGVVPGRRVLGAGRVTGRSCQRAGRTSAAPPRRRPSWRTPGLPRRCREPPRARRRWRMRPPLAAWLGSPHRCGPAREAWPRTRPCPPRPRWPHLRVRQGGAVADRHELAHGGVAAQRRGEVGARQRGDGLQRAGGQFRPDHAGRQGDARDRLEQPGGRVLDAAGVGERRGGHRRGEPGGEQDRHHLGRLHRFLAAHGADDDPVGGGLGHDADPAHPGGPGQADIGQPRVQRLGEQRVRAQVDRR